MLGASERGSEAYIRYVELSSERQRRRPAPAVVLQEAQLLSIHTPDWALRCFTFYFLLHCPGLGAPESV